MKLKKVLIGVLCVCMSVGIVTSVSSVETKAKAKKGVYFQLKKGILTIYGKGEMPKNMNFEYNKKIKKVVVKKGVKSISENAFYGCENLKSVKLPSTLKKINNGAFGKTKITKLTIPSSVKEIGNYAVSSSKKMQYIKMPGTVEIVDGDYEFEPDSLFQYVDTIEFSTDLSISLCDRLVAGNYKVYKKDKNYKSIDGVIYTKDGSEALIIPSREKVVIKEGCRIFDLDAFLNLKYFDDYSYPDPYVKEIILPKSIIRIKKTGERDNEYWRLYNSVLEKIVLKNKNINKIDIDYYTSNYGFEYVRNGLSEDCLLMKRNITEK